MPILEERSQLTNWHKADTSDKYTNLRGDIRGGIEVPDPVSTIGSRATHCLLIDDRRRHRHRDHRTCFLHGGAPFGTHALG